MAGTLGKWLSVSGQWRKSAAFSAAALAVVSYLAISVAPDTLAGADEVPAKAKAQSQISAPAQIPATRAADEPTSSGVQLTGFGFGHGHGMGQWGAYGYATVYGWDYQRNPGALLRWHPARDDARS